MRRISCLCVIFFSMSVAAFGAAAEEQSPPQGENFYVKSLHYTNRGIEFVYSKEHGGLERLTGMSATEMGCLKAKCHVQSCDACHKVEVDGKASYSVENARSEAACKTCHPVAADNPDVHFKSGMKCMDCHSAREVHGDGVAYDTYMRPGFFDARCENCHSEISQIPSHTVHRGKLECAACHSAQVATCFNCHLDERLAGGKDPQIERKGLIFLVNHGDKIQLANVLTYVYGNKTMITVAPTFSHTIVKEGRACEACHATSNVREIRNGKLSLFSWSNGEARSAEGVIPVIDGMKWNVAFLDRKGESWVPLADPAEPLINFSGFGTPLSRNQLAKLERRQTKK